MDYPTKIFLFDTYKPLQSLDFLLSFEKWMFLKTYIQIYILFLCLPYLLRSAFNQGQRYSLYSELPCTVSLLFVLNISVEM